MLNSLRACAAPTLIGGAASAQEFPIQSIKIIAKGAPGSRRGTQSRQNLS